MSTPEVVVACAWYNRADYIRDTVDSLLAQDFDSFEVVIVNDGSTDPRVREILDSYDDPRLRVIHQENTGFTVAIKRAIAASDAPYIAIQGAGDISHPSRIRIQKNFLEETPDASAVGCWFVNVMTEGLQRRIVRRPPKEISDARYLMGKNIYGHGEVMIRRSSFELAGGYRTQFYFAQDRDLWLRLISYGKLCTIPQELYERRQFKIDGLSSNIRKTLIQITLSDLAVQCAKVRDETHFDIISQYKDQALLFRGPSLRVAKFLFAMSIILTHQNQGDAKLFICLLKKESLFLYYLFLLSKDFFIFLLNIYSKNPHNYILRKIFGRIDRFL